MFRYLFLFIALTGSAQAEPWHVEVAGGYTTFHQYKQDGTRFYQEAFPWSSDMTSPAGRVGVGQKINDRWAYTVSWLYLGRNSVEALYVHDDDYDPVAHRCLRGCDKPTHAGAYGSGKGPEFALRRNFESVYIRGGLFVWIADLNVVGWHQGDPKQEYRWRQATQTMLAPFLGVGVRHKFNGWEVFADVSHYVAVESTGGYPLAKKATVPMLGFKVGL